MAELEPGAIFAGHRIEGVAGRGGFGVVYRATHLHLDHVVALKLISAGRGAEETFRERFISESRIAVSIRHPNVVAVHNAGEEDGLLFVTMDFIDGTDLRGLLNREGRLRPEDAVDIVRQVAAALDAAHAKGLVHRDIKPGNVLIDERDGGRHVYLTDFGLSKQMDATSGVTATGAFVGTLDYVAPEQIKGDRVDARTDVYALGCVMFELLSGELPFAQSEKVAKIYAHLQEQPPELVDAAPEVPAALSEVVWRAMAKSPDDRYPSAGDMARACGAAIEGRQPSEPERNVGVGAAAPTQAYDVLAAAAAGAGIDETVESQPAQAAGSTAEVAPPEGATEAVPPPARIPPAEAEVTPEASAPGETIAVPPPDAPSADAPSEGATPPAHTARPKRGGGGKVLVGVVAALALAGGAYAVLGGGGEEEPSGSGGQEQSGGNSGGGGGGTDLPAGVEELAKVAPQPVGIDVTSDGTLYITSRAGEELSRVPAGSGKALDPVKLDGEAEQLNVDPDDFIWVAINRGEEEAGQVQRFNDNGEPENTFDVGVDPRGVAGGKENQWVVNSGSDSVTKIDREDFSVDQITVGSEPARASEGVAQTAASGIWVSNAGAGTVSRITAFGDVVSTVAGVGQEPRGIVATEDFVWAADQANSALFKIKPVAAESIANGGTGGEVVDETDLSDECEEPRSVDDGFESIWVTCANGVLVRVNQASGKVETAVDIPPDPEGVLAVDGEAVFVTSSGANPEQDDGIVYRVDPDAVK
jgi:serine/threonine-protein kinase